jgi:DNA-binding transcriptional MerR regulator
MARKVFVRKVEFSMHLRPIDLARASGLSVSQVRTYERLGFLPPADRSPSGYRLYTERHADAMRLSRTLISGYGWQTALDVMRAIHANDTAAVLELVNASHARLDHQRHRIATALEAIDALIRRSRPVSTDARPLHIEEAARTVDVTASTLRFWEQQGLLKPARDAGSRYRLYDSEQLQRLNTVALLRDAGYTFDWIREVLSEVTSGTPGRVRTALLKRSDALRESSRRCIVATAAVEQTIHRTDA